jgi:putative transposase
MASAMTRQVARMRLMDATLVAGVKVGNVSQWCRLNGVDRRTFYRHRQRIVAEGAWRPRSRRPRSSPAAAPAQVAEQIIGLRAALAPDNGADAIVAALAAVAARDCWRERGWRVPHRSTVNKILKREGLVTPQPQKRPKSSWRRFAYARPRDCYQIDATQVRLASGAPVVVFDVLDDCTRLLAACLAAPAETAAAAIAAITAAAAACGAPAIVLSDNGTAFTSRLTRGGTSSFTRTVTGLGSRLIHSAPYHPQTCGKVERHHQTLKRWLAAQPAQPATLPALQLLLDTYRDHYNTARHHSAHGTTPRQAWDAAASHGGPGHLPRQDDATVQRLTVTSNGNATIAGNCVIHIGRHHAGTTITVIRDQDHLTAYTPSGTPLGHLHINHAKRYQGTLTPAA